MLQLSQLRSQYKDRILALAAHYGARNIRVFGSLARGQNTDGSDIDFLVEFDPERSLFYQGGFLMDLQDLLGRKIDVVDEHAMRPRFREHALKDAVPL